MDFRAADLTPRECYKLLVSTVAPRPIALVTSMSAEGHLNAAPFSFFNAMGGNPPTIVLGIGDRDPGMPKDSARNIAQTHEFVVNLVDENIAERMNVCSVDFPPDFSELDVVKLATAPSIQVKIPRLVESPVNLECRHHSTVPVGHNRIIIGEVVHFHIRDDLMDMEKLYVGTEKMHLIGRMHGSGWYTRTRDLFQMQRQSYDEWLQDRSGRAK